MEYLLVTAFLSAFSVALLYWLLSEHFRYWKKRNIPYLKVNSYLFGNDLDFIKGYHSIAEHHLKMYKDLAPHKIGGYFSFQKPVLVVRDLELIRNVLTKDFQHFEDRKFDSADPHEPITMHLFNLMGEEWKYLRSRLTPTFTSSKMKLMFPMVKEKANQLVNMIRNCVETDPNIELKNICGRYTMDVISTCAFGLNANSINNCSGSKFTKMISKIITPTVRTRIHDFLFQISPRLTKAIRFHAINKEATIFFNQIVRETVEYRQKNNISRNDFLNLAMTLLNDGSCDQEKAPVDFNLDLLTAQCFVFFVGGHETSSSAMSFALFELARNREVQKKIQNEVDRIYEKYGGELGYESMDEMTYMDKIIAEITRMYPALPVLFRTCTKPYKVPGTDLILNKGDELFIPMFGIHYDPQYYSNPDVFDPEHFSEEAKAKRPHYTYLPFGEGPRICIGMRFGKMQMKLGLAFLIRNFEFSVSSKMKLPMRFSKHSILTNSEGGIWLTCKKRNV